MLEKHEIINVAGLICIIIGVIIATVVTPFIGNGFVILGNILLIASVFVKCRHDISTAVHG